jgi:hypothetical protein
MKQIFNASALSLLILMTGCGYKASDDNSGTPAQTIQVPSSVSAFTTDSTNKNINKPAAETQTTGAITPVTSTNTGSTAGLNPAHGQPGHRCDIAVGAPLDSKPIAASTNGSTPTTTNTTPTTITSTPQTVQPVATPTKSASGVNPAHGQPGHRCDIAVGAPLDSKPTTVATTTSNPASTSTVVGSSPFNGNNSTPQKTTVSPIPVTPVLPAGNTQSAVPTPAGMNPAHGQPGHRCDIAVGAPLNSKPTTTTPVKQ